MKAKDKKKDTPDSKKKQLLSIFHQSVEFLQIFSIQQIDTLSDKVHIFVFTRGNILAKQKQLIDFVGVMAEGRATCKSRSYEIGDVIGYNQLLGIQNVHPETILGEADGIVIAIRIIDLLTIEKTSLKNKILSRFMQISINKKIKREEISKTISQYETIDEKKVTKLFTPEWTNFLSNQMDAKEKVKFHNYFPYYKLKQKDLIANSTSKTYLILLWEGQLISKNKHENKDHKIIQPGHMFNQEGFIFNQIPSDNVYCLSSDAIVTIVDKHVFIQSFKTQTFKAFSKIVLSQVEHKYATIEEVNNEREEKDQNQWSIFKKYPNVSILPLPKKSDNNKNIKAVLNNNEANAHLNAYQTLFKEQLGFNNQKVKTNTSQAESGYEKLFTLKSQPAAKEIQSGNQLQRLRKQVQMLTEKLKFSQQMNKINRLDLMEYKSRLNMQLIFKQISQLYSDGEILSNKSQEATNASQLVTLKEAFDKQMASNKIQMLVAKCAFRWLHITRKRKAQRPT